MGNALSAASRDELRRSLAGQVVVPTDADFDGARRELSL